MSVSLKSQVKYKVRASFIKEVITANTLNGSSLQNGLFSLCCLQKAEMASCTSVKVWGERESSERWNTTGILWKGTELYLGRTFTHTRSIPHVEPQKCCEDSKKAASYDAWVWGAEQKHKSTVVFLREWEQWLQTPGTEEVKRLKTEENGQFA